VVRHIVLPVLPGVQGGVRRAAGSARRRYRGAVQHDGERKQGAQHQASYRGSASHDTSVRRLTRNRKACRGALARCTAG
jgi:hypothetical protein